MGRRNNRNNAQASKKAASEVTDEEPIVDETPTAETSEVSNTSDVAEETQETPSGEDTEDTAEEVEETSDTEEENLEDEVVEKDVAEEAGEKIYWVEGYGNVRAKSQSAAEKQAKKILADLRK